MHTFFSSQHIITAYFTLELSPFSWQMSPPRRKCPDPKPRRRALIFFIVGCKWGVPSHPEEEAQGLLLEVGSLSCLFLVCFFYMAFYSPLYSYPCISLSFYLSGVDSAEKSQFPVGGGPQDRSGSPMPGNWGAGKNGNGSCRFRGGGFLWVHEGSNVTFLPILSPIPSQENLPYPICHHLPSAPPKSPQDLKFLILQTRQWSIPLQLSFQLQRQQSLPICNPFVFCWGASSKCTHATLRAAKRVHQPHMPPSACMYARCT